MREDTFKIITERRRSGRSWTKKSNLRYDRCEDRTRVTGRRLVLERFGWTKHLKENPAPLKRYLHKQIGRRWDEVYSEICEYLEHNTTVKIHVRNYLDSYIHREVRRTSDGILWTTYYGVIKVVDSWTGLYVDPDDGLVKGTRDLCKKLGVTPMRDRRKNYGYYDGIWGLPPKKKPIKKIALLSWHVRLKGIWYKIELSAAPIWRDGRHMSENQLYGVFAGLSQCTTERWRIVSKQQLSSKALKSHGLKNRPYSSKEGHYG